MNKYDKDYDAAIKRILIPKETFPIRDRPECAEATKREPRDLEKSELAKDEGYQAFLKIVNEVLGKRYDKEEAISVQWSTGGIDGGSCWDSSDPQSYISNELPKELTELDEILTKVCPSITFLQYKILTKKVLHNDSYIEYEYYGNCTNYSVTYCLFSELYKELKAQNIFSDG